MRNLKQFFSTILLMLSVSLYSQNIQIPDFYLENAIRVYMDKPIGEITQSDLSSLERFVAVGRNIINLKGLEHVRNLTDIMVYYGNNLDGSNKQSLKKLKMMVKTST